MLIQVEPDPGQTRLSLIQVELLPDPPRRPPVRPNVIVRGDEVDALLEPLPCERFRTGWPPDPVVPAAYPAQDIYISQSSAWVRAHARVVPVYLVQGEPVEGFGVA